MILTSWSVGKDGTVVQKWAVGYMTTDGFCPTAIGSQTVMVSFLNYLNGGTSDYWRMADGKGEIEWR